MHFYFFNNLQYFSIIISLLLIVSFYVISKKTITKTFSKDYLFYIIRGFGLIIVIGTLKFPAFFIHDKNLT